jgi:hypothetical protein
MGSDKYTMTAIPRDVHCDVRAIAAREKEKSLQGVYRDVIEAGIHTLKMSAGKPWRTVTSGAGAPSTTPAAIGDVYVDTEALKIFAATGTASSADWQAINSEDM